MAQWWGLSVSRVTTAAVCLSSTAWPMDPGPARCPPAPGLGATSSRRWVTGACVCSVGDCCKLMLFQLMLFQFCISIFYNYFSSFLVMFLFLEWLLHLLIYLFHLLIFSCVHWSIKSFNCLCVNFIYLLCTPPLTTPASSQIANGFVTDLSKDYYFGDEARVQCHRGYRLMGSAIIQCGPEQQFINLPTCQGD